MPRQFDYLLLGGGTSCGYAAAAIRGIDKTGSIGIVGAEDQPPYDRPPFSKNFLTNEKMAPDDAHSKDESFYPENNIELLLGAVASGIDTAGKSVTLRNEQIGFGKLLYALGSEPRRPTLPGSDRVLLLRTYLDSLKIRDQIGGAKSAVIIGGGFIGVEVAASLLSRGVTVTLIEFADKLYSKQPSQVVSDAVLREIQAMGGTVHLGDSAAEVTPSGVKTSSGREILGEIVIAGIGATPKIEIARAAGLRTDHGVLADAGLRASEDVWVAGDVAEYEDAVLGRRFRAEHHLHAKWSGEHAGKAMAGEPTDYRKAPYFYSDIGELSFILRGDPDFEGRTFTFGVAEAPVWTEVTIRPDGSIARMLDIRRDYKEQDPLNDLYEQLIVDRTAVGDALEGLDNPLGLRERVLA
jgi:3-phenylpropionate/trans-cinnamate dioxygenase ferredoxin reductase subunit